MSAGAERARRGDLLDRAKRWAAAGLWRAGGRTAANRARLFGGASGLRIVTFHETGTRELRQLRELTRWWRDHRPLARPQDADLVHEGRWPYGEDRLLVTFDDGMDSNHAAGEWLAREGIAATFFVVPSLVDRTVDAYVRFHEERGVVATRPGAGARGLSTTQVRELAAMGHRVAAHNFAHRDLGPLHRAEEIRYEVANALERIGEIVGVECSDFALAFGQPENVSDEAVRFLLDRPALRVYACHRGLNAPGRSPRFLLRHTCEPEHPAAFTRVCVEGGGDHHVIGRVRDMARRAGTLPDRRGEAAVGGAQKFA